MNLGRVPTQPTAQLGILLLTTFAILVIVPAVCRGAKRDRVQRN
jgi:hypothetical protein